MTDIKVGDTVRVKEGASLYDPQAVGKTLVISFVHNGATPYVVANGEYTGGFWLKDVELVSPFSSPRVRWRYNDHIVVYPLKFGVVPACGVDVLDENEPKVYKRWRDSVAHPAGEITDAAQAYWDAHETNPVIKEAKTRGDYVRFAYQLRYNDSEQWLAKYTKADIDAALPVIDRLALKESE